MHRDRFLVNKTNRRIELQFYWYYDSKCFGQSFCTSSGVLSRTPALVQIMQFGDWVLPGAYSVTKLHTLYKCQCTTKNSWWWAEKLPETCRVVIPIKLELSASVGFIHKESIIHSSFQSTMLELWVRTGHLLSLLWYFCFLVSKHIQYSYHVP